MTSDLLAARVKAMEASLPASGAPPPAEPFPRSHEPLWTRWLSRPGSRRLMLSMPGGSTGSEVIRGSADMIAAGQGRFATTAACRILGRRPDRLWW